MKRFEDIWRNSNHFFYTGQKINWEKFIKKVIAKSLETIDQLVKTIDQYKNLFQLLQMNIFNINLRKSKSNWIIIGYAITISIIGTIEPENHHYDFKIIVIKRK